MGSTGFYPPAGQTAKEAIREYVGADRVVDIACTGFVAYVAYRSALDDKIVALVMPYSYRDGYLVVKDQDETMGPFDVACPKRILDQLDPTEYQHAIEWRAKCRARLEKVAAAKRVKPGTVIRLAQPVEFTGGWGAFDTFKFEKGSTFLAMRDGFPVVRVRVSRWRERAFEEVAA